MASESYIKLEGFEELVKRLDVPGFRTVAKAGIRAGGAHLKKKFAEYPPKANRRMWPYMTPKAKRYFWWALGQGIIEVPYRRGSSPGSEKMGANWTVTTPNWYTATVGNKAKYAKYVMGDKEDQARYHQGIWQPASQIAAMELDDIMDKVRDKIQAKLAGKTTIG